MKNKYNINTANARIFKFPCSIVWTSNIGFLGGNGQGGGRGGGGGMFDIGEVFTLILTCGEVNMGDCSRDAFVSPFLGGPERVEVVDRAPEEFIFFR